MRSMMRAVATWAQVRRMALALPKTSERSSRGLKQWRVREKLFLWERPLRKKDLEELGADAPHGPILGARTDGLDAKEALLASNPRVFFTTSHFDGYPAVLVRLEKIPTARLKALVAHAWTAQAP
jgi:hypothetical protein